ncbi:sensor histidine kinase [Mucilaginibacter litoreus]|uniref:Sensor histidine kinase n=1 Tax=Mucilaginibacter litoreus TaxID=1048221 RepID=A0ABW3APG2_9SPHI
MRYLSFSRQDVWVLFVTVYPAMMILAYLLLKDAYFTLPLFIYATLITWLIGTCSWVFHITAANILNYVVPQYTKTHLRIAMQMMVYAVLTQLMCISLFFAYKGAGFIRFQFNWSNYSPLFITGFLINVVATSFHEGIKLFDKWKISLVETEKLKKINLQSQLDSLKNQVNPHFLFNSLNCLSSLISSDPDKASEFLDEMSKVYRYLLRSNEFELIPLSSELQFVHSFFHMLKTRYGDGIELHIDVADNKQDLLIPPLTLQMLIENAVKHNTILKNRPLKIDIKTDEAGFLTVINNRQKKVSKVLSNKIGLQNIIAKYELLNHSGVIINQDNEVFSVSLPLIKNL